jgi:phosphate-selective porin
MKKIFFVLLSLISIQFLYAQEKPSPEGTSNWSGYIQSRFTVTQNDSINKETSGFRIRRAKIIFNANPIEHVSFKIQGIFKEDNYNGAFRLQDAYAVLDFIPEAIITVGQMVPPFSRERLTPDAEIYSIDRSQAVDNLIPNAETFVRDIGIKVNGDLLENYLSYSLGIFNGNGANKTQNDDNNFLYVARLAMAPFKENLHFSLGASASYRKVKDQSFQKIYGNTAFFIGKDFRYEIDANVDYKGFSLIGEYLHAQITSETTKLNSICPYGYYIQAAYFVLDDLQAITKYENYTANAENKTLLDLNWFHFGLNYYINKNKFKIMAEFIKKDETVINLKNDSYVIQLQVML